MILSNGMNSSIVIAQCENFPWAKSAGGVSQEYSNNTATDASGNVYVVGEFESSSLIFGSDTLVNTFSSLKDIYLTKYDPDGNVLWARSAGGTDQDYTTDVATDD